MRATISYVVRWRRRGGQGRGSLMSVIDGCCDKCGGHVGVYALSPGDPGQQWCGSCHNLWGRRTTTGSGFNNTPRPTGPSPGLIGGSRILGGVLVKMLLVWGFAAVLFVILLFLLL